MKQTKTTDPFYKSKQWRTIRKVILTRDKCCINCGYFGKGLTVDHILERKKYPQFALKQSNLRVLCRICDNKRHNNKACKDKSTPPKPAPPTVNADGYNI